MPHQTRRTFLRRMAWAGALAAAGAARAAALPHPLKQIRITRIEAASLRGTRPRLVGRNARLGVHGRHGSDPVVRLHTDAGPCGWGWSRAKRDAKATRDLLGKRLADVFDPATGTRDAFLAFDFPLWDLAGRVLGRPVHAMLGDAGPNPVPVYDGSIYFDDLDPESGKDRGIAPVLDAVGMGLARGFRAFKVKIGRGHKWMEKEAGFARDVAVLRAIRDRVGPKVRLLVDANNGYTPDGARNLMRRARNLNLSWFEEPFPEAKDTCLAFRAFLREGTYGTLLADGEGSRRNVEAFTEIVRAGGIDVVQFDLRGFTLTRWRGYAPVLEETGTVSSPHNWGSHLSGFYIAQFARGCGRFALGEVDTMAMPEVLAAGYRLADGMMTVPHAPGFGLDLDEDRFARRVKEAGWTLAME